MVLWPQPNTCPRLSTSDSLFLWICAIVVLPRFLSLVNPIAHLRQGPLRPFFFVGPEFSILSLAHSRALKSVQTHPHKDVYPSKWTPVSFTWTKELWPESPLYVSGPNSLVSVYSLICCCPCFFVLCRTVTRISFSGVWAAAKWLALET